MFEISDGNIFDPELELDMILNPVNCKGVSGAGLAKAFAERFPRSQADYENVSKKEMMLPDATGRKRKTKIFQPGDILHYIDMNIKRMQTFQSSLSEDLTEEDKNEQLQEFINENIQHVVFFPTKNHWKRPSKMEYVEAGLSSLRQLLENDEVKDKVKRIGIPALGAGLGKLDPKEVSVLIREKLGDLDYTFVLFSPLE